MAHEASTRLRMALRRCLKAVGLALRSDVVHARQLAGQAIGEALDAKTALAWAEGRTPIAEAECDFTRRCRDFYRWETTGKNPAPIAMACMLNEAANVIVALRSKNAKPVTMPPLVAEPDQ